MCFYVSNLRQYQLLRRVLWISAELTIVSSLTWLHSFGFLILDSYTVTIENISQDCEIQIICLVDLYPIDSELHILHNASTGKSSVICNVSITVLVYYFLEYKFPYLKMSLMGKLIYWLISTHFFLLKKIPTNLLRETYILKLFYKEFYFIYDLQS